MADAHDREPEAEASSREEAASHADELWKKILLSAASVVVFFGLLEGGLAILGVKPGATRADPLVGFASTRPVFVPVSESAGAELLETAPGKLEFFNRQRFRQPKPQGTRRMFSLGGSTTYGRPYDDKTSFTGWLRDLLPIADPGTRWELINAGGISYASYRVARVAEEIAAYEPDVLIVYTGHNEFLEERTYGSLRDLPTPVKSLTSLLSRTRIWSAMSSALRRTERSGPAAGDGQTILPGRVKAKLDEAAGLDRYRRDDVLRDEILVHYKASVERIIDITRLAGADLIFVTPASNLKDCSPFKSELTSRSAEAAANLDEALERVEALHRAGRLPEALQIADAVLQAEERHAGLHFQRGKVLFELGRFDEAKVAFRRARDEDVCPLRALTPMREILEQVATRRGVPVVDFIALVEKETRARHGHSIPGEEYFLDHVHPTIEGHRLLALELVEAMARLGVVSISDGWTKSAIREVTARVEASLDKSFHARALAKLSLVLDWAGKNEDSRRLAFQALELGSEDPVLLTMAARHAAIEGREDEALGYFRRSLAQEFVDPNAHFQVGLLLSGRGEKEAAAAHLFAASVLAPDNDQVHRHLGFLLLELEQARAALRSFQTALELNPQSESLAERIDALSRRLGVAGSLSGLPKTGVVPHPSGAPKVLSEARSGPDGRYVSDGIRTEWYESGALKRFAVLVNEIPVGVDVSWEPSGEILSRTEH